MRLTAIKEGKILRILSDSGDIPDHIPLQISVTPLATDPWQSAQLDSAFANDEDWGNSLDALVIKKESK